MKSCLTLFTCASLGIATIHGLSQSGHAQSNPDNGGQRVTETTGPKRFWQASLSGGDYMVALDQITAISKHNYVIDGNIAVTEVVIDTNGNSLARFYHLAPVGQNASNMGVHLGQKGKQLLDKAGQRTGMDLSSAVIKQYPTTTHAKTVEFRVLERGDLDRLLESVRNAWINGRGRKFSIVGDG
jgi:hypothetical protein